METSEKKFSKMNKINAKPLKYTWYAKELFVQTFLRANQYVEKYFTSAQI